ncbi:acyltransferase [Klebsiella pneumoniae]|nr:acyltransferase [Klebsiella pneumoniae]
MRQLWVDYAKGFGIILVVFGHVNRGLFNAGVSINTEVYHSLDNIIYSFHMPLFFFLSGLFFIESISGKSKKKFISGKFKSIFYPYAVWSILQGCIEVILSNYTNSKTTLLSVLSFPFHPRAQFWFLYALLLIFILSCIIYNKYFTKHIPFILVLSFLAYIYGEKIISVYYINYIFDNSVFFFLGCLVYKYTNLLKSLLNLNSFFILTCVFILVEYLYFIRLGNNYFALNLYTAAIAIVGIFWISNLSIVLSRYDISWLSLLGRQSIIIFLVHILASSGVRIILTKFLHIDNWYFNISVGTIAGIILPLVFYHLAMRLKMQFLFVYPSSKTSNSLK